MDVDAVVGRRLWRDSWRFLEMPLDLLNEELDRLAFLEKLLLTLLLEGGGPYRDEEYMIDSWVDDRKMM